MVNGMKTVLRSIAAALAVCGLLWGCGGTPFTSEDWKRADMTERQGLVRSLMREYDLVGWRESDVIRLLGPESSADPDFSWSLRCDTEDTLVYALGAANYSEVQALVVTLGEDRIVTGWELVSWSM